MKTSKLIVSILIGALFIFSGCSKSGIAGKEFVTDEMKSQNPFHGGEMLYFMSDSNEQFTFQVANRTSNIYEYPLGNDIDYYYLVEVEKTHIGSVNTEEHYRILMEANGLYKQHNITYSFENKGMGFIFDLPITKENTQFVDSINIMEHWYYNVFIDEVEKQDDRAYKLYYSTQYGVVKIDFSDDSYWELDKIEW